VGFVVVLFDYMDFNTGYFLVCFRKRLTKRNGVYEVLMRRTCKDICAKCTRIQTRSH